MDGGGGGFPPGDDFECPGHAAEEETEREDPDVNIPASTHETEEAIEGAELGHRFPAPPNDAGAREGIKDFRAKEETEIEEGLG